MRTGQQCVMFCMCGKVSHLLLVVVIISLVVLLMQSPFMNRTTMCHVFYKWKGQPSFVDCGHYFTGCFIDSITM